MKIVIDAFGGDHAPGCIVDGTIMALKKFDDIEIVLTGDEEKLNNILKTKKYDASRVTIINAPDVITNDDVPTDAIKHKTNSSLVVAFDYLKSHDDCVALISAGSTGAVLTGGFLKIGRIKGVSRPALAPFFPNAKGGMTCIIDCGANVECKPINLCHFALMGSLYYKIMFGVENPKVALLSNGSEEKKGNELCKETYPLLKQLPINFIGNVEARYFMTGDVDVMVSDGFSGNILIKSVEGAVKFTTKVMKQAMLSTFFSKIGALLCKRSIGKVKDKLDYHKYGGALFIGCKKTIIKSHGSSRDVKICAAIEQARKLEINKVNEQIKKMIENTPEINFGIGEHND